MVAKLFDRQNGFVSPLPGIRYSDCNSAPLLGVKFMRKWGSRSYQGPGMPSCSVQLSAECPASGWSFLVASLAPNNSGANWGVLPFQTRFTQTWLIR
jgi:hypothetical protein